MARLIYEFTPPRWVRTFDIVRWGGYVNTGLFSVGDHHHAGYWYIGSFIPHARGFLHEKVMRWWCELQTVSPGIADHSPKIDFNRLVKCCRGIYLVKTVGLHVLDCDKLLEGIHADSIIHEGHEAGR